MATITDRRLYGHVLYQRFMHADYKTGLDEMRNWLALYNDHPGAAKIFRMAVSRNGGSDKGLKKPGVARGVVVSHEPLMTAAQTYKSKKSRTGAQQTAVKNFKHSVSALVKKGQAGAALNKLQGGGPASGLDNVEYDTLQAQIAAGYLYKGQTKTAFDLASKSARRSGLQAPMAGWVAGLISWQHGNYRQAAQFFEMTARSPYASGWTSSGGAYWAARAHMRSGNVKAVSVWLKRAAAHPRTFYGLIATRALGQDFDFNWNVPKLTNAYLNLLISNPSGNRAVALVAANQHKLAEAELMRINPGDNQDMRDAVLSYAGYVGMPALAMRLGSLRANDDGAYYDAALYPTGPWQPKEGYKIDPALIHAIMRQESKFDPEAQSPAGARGLMQLMPRTARYVAKGLKHDASLNTLTDPQTNLELGQKYIEELLNDKSVNNDLMSLLIAYNAGPGNLSRWKKMWPGVKDPLLFIEIMPSAETRGYVERVLANYWIYRLREGQETQTLDALAAGKPAIYAGLEAPATYKLASR
jgi:soluble lytic murein transglycosylase-like protein